MTWHRNPITADQLESARRQLASGERMGHIARAMNIRPDWLKGLLDPKHAQSRRKKQREAARRRRRQAAKPVLAPILHPDVREYVVVPHDVLFERDRARAQNQSLGSYLMGDPLPGRSALDRMGHR